MAEPIEMPFGVWTRVGPRKHMLDGVHIGATWRIRLNRPCAAAMWPFCQITLTTCDVLQSLLNNHLNGRFVDGFNSITGTLRGALCSAESVSGRRSPSRPGAVRTHHVSGHQQPLTGRLNVGNDGGGGAVGGRSDRLGVSRMTDGDDGRTERRHLADGDGRLQ